MKVIYIAGPYRAYCYVKHEKTISISGIYANIQNARRVAETVWMFEGLIALCPHLNTAFMDDPLIGDEKFLTGGLELLKRSDILLALPQWDQSSGTRAEIEFAIKNKIPVRYLKDLENDCLDVVGKIAAENSDVEKLKDKPDKNPWRKLPDELPEYGVPIIIQTDRGNGAGGITRFLPGDEIYYTHGALWKYAEDRT